MSFATKTLSGSKAEQYAQLAAQARALIHGEPDRIAALVDRVARAGIRTLVLTVDTAVLANRENNLRSGFSTPLRETAIRSAVENAEDDDAAAEASLRELGLSENDTVVGISASGRTPYVVGGLTYARSVGAFTAAIASNAGSDIGAAAEVAIEVVTGPELNNRYCKPLRTMFQPLSWPK